MCRRLHGPQAIGSPGLVVWIDWLDRSPALQPPGLPDPFADPRAAPARRGGGPPGFRPRPRRNPPPLAGRGPKARLGRWRSSAAARRRRGPRLARAARAGRRRSPAGDAAIRVARAGAAHRGPGTLPPPVREGLRAALILRRRAAHRVRFAWENDRRRLRRRRRRRRYRRCTHPGCSPSRLAGPVAGPAGTAGRGSGPRPGKRATVTRPSAAGVH